jgi:hypothetical protein
LTWHCSTGRKQCLLPSRRLVILDIPGPHLAVTDKCCLSPRAAAGVRTPWARSGRVTLPFFRLASVNRVLFWHGDLLAKDAFVLSRYIERSTNFNQVCFCLCFSVLLVLSIHSHALSLDKPVSSFYVKIASLYVQCLSDVLPCCVC